MYVYVQYMYGIYQYMYTLIYMWTYIQILEFIQVLPCIIYFYLLLDVVVKWSRTYVRTLIDNSGLIISNTKVFYS